MSGSSRSGSKTKDFLSKICYKKGASVDMTKNGFIRDSKVNPMKLIIKPLREKLDEFCGPSTCSTGNNQKGGSKKSLKGAGFTKHVRTNLSKFKMRKQNKNPIQEEPELEEEPKKKVRIQL